MSDRKDTRKPQPKRDEPKPEPKPEKPKGVTYVVNGVTVDPNGNPAKG